MENSIPGDLSQRVADLEARLDALESAATPTDAPPTSAPPPELPWVIRELREREPVAGGSVVFAGEVAVGDTVAAYQWQRPTTYLTGQSWDQPLDRLAALTHPVRGGILQRLLNGAATAAELVSEEVVSSPGTAYHHLNALAAGGWIIKDVSGRHAVRTSRIVALLTIITAAEDH